MKKKILLFALMLAIALCTLVVAVGAVNGYSTFDITLTDGTKTTAYTSGVDPWEGRVYLNSTLYKGPAEAPPVGSEDIDWSGVEQFDWTEVEVLDFTNATLYVLDKNKGVYNTQAYGTNQGGTALCICLNGLNKTTQLTSLKKIITGKIVTVRGAAFNTSPALEEIVISNGLKEIQYNAFDTCPNLKKVTVLPGSNLTSIGNQSFKNCPLLESFELENCTVLTSIGNNVFNGCKALKSASIPNSVTSILDSCFANCSSLKSVTWPTGTTTIQNSTFYGCSSLVFSIPSNITSIGSSAFSGCTSLTEIYIPGTVTYLGSDCFRGCTGVTKLEIHPSCSVTHIYAHTFDSVKVSNIVLPNTVQQIGQSSLNYSNLVSINLGASFVGFNASNAGQPPFSSGSSLRYVYLSNTFTAEYVRNCIFSWNDNNANEYNKNYVNLTFFFTGTMAQAQAILNAANGDYTVAADGSVTGARVNTYIGTAQLISAADYAAAVANGTLEEGVSGSPRRYFVYDYNKCDAFYNGNHIENLAEGQIDTNPCVLTECKTCGAKNLDTSSDATHNFDAGVIAYVNGFASVGTFTVSCQNANCVCNVNPAVTSVPAIYTYLGFAVKEDQTSLTLGYTFDKEAYESYIANNAENVVAFGFVAYATYEDESCNPLSVNSGVISPANPAKTIFASMSVNFAAYDFVIRGFDEATQDLNIAMCAYTYDGNNIKYLCKNTEGVYGAYDVAYATTISKEA